MAATKPISTQTRIIIGAIGGISPIIVSLLVVNVGALYHQLGLMDGIGLIVRFLVLVFIGGLVGYLHQSENEPFKIFQLGIAAPALLATAINGTSISPHSMLKEYHAQAQAQASSYSFFPTADAAELKYQNSDDFKNPTVSNIQLFIRGLIGVKLLSDFDDYYVIAGSHKNPSDAEAQVKQILAKGFLAKVYTPDDGSHYYPVVIGANLNLDEASKLQAAAIRHGLPQDTYLWKRK